MSDQHFVYAEFSTADQASRAVSALVDGSFDPDQIDVLSVTGSHVARVPIQHRRPAVAGAASGTLIGMLIGLSVGLLSEHGVGADAWLASTHWILLGAACGFLAGGLAGGGWWRSGVRIRGVLAQAQSFVVGIIVANTRSLQVEKILGQTLPLKTGRYPVTDAEVALQYAEHIALVAA